MRKTCSTEGERFEHGSCSAAGERGSHISVTAGLVPLRTSKNVSGKRKCKQTLVMVNVHRPPPPPIDNQY